MRAVVFFGLLGLVFVAAAQRIPPPDLFEASYQGVWTFGDGSTITASGTTAYDKVYSRSYFSAIVPTGQNNTIPVAFVSYRPDIGYEYVEHLGYCEYTCVYGECCADVVDAVSLVSGLTEARALLHSIVRAHASLSGKNEPTAVKDYDDCGCETATINVLELLPLCTLQSGGCCNDFGVCGDLYQSRPLGGYVVASYCLSGETPLYASINSTDPYGAYPDDLIAYRLDFENYQTTVKPSLFNAPVSCVCRQSSSA
mmetsp:Transcript_14449/g.56813  ORF Transcript_14449/g.56813 Transcript_14449/m.56813 type:complete len:255 (-) Transcript_14449:214-978(-)